jgi:hypothetical protein
MLFKRKENVEEYCTFKLVHLLSQDTDDKWEAFRTNCNDPSLTAADGTVYSNNLCAASLELMFIAITRNSKFGVGAAARDFVFNWLNQRTLSKIPPLCGEYNGAFGSSYVDGVRAMVLLFAEKVTGSQIGETAAQALYDYFYVVFRGLVDELKSIKLVALPTQISSPVSSATPTVPQNLPPAESMKKLQDWGQPEKEQLQGNLQKLLAAYTSGKTEKEKDQLLTQALREIEGTKADASAGSGTHENDDRPFDPVELEEQVRKLKREGRLPSAEEFVGTAEQIREEYRAKLLNSSEGEERNRDEYGTIGYCNSCGMSLETAANFCSKCGAPTAPTPSSTSKAVQVSSGSKLASNGDDERLRLRKELAGSVDAQDSLMMIDIAKVLHEMPEGSSVVALRKYRATVRAGFVVLDGNVTQTLEWLKKGLLNPERSPGGWKLIPDSTLDLLLHPPIDESDNPPDAALAFFVLTSRGQFAFALSHLYRSDGQVHWISDANIINRIADVLVEARLLQAS